MADTHIVGPATIDNGHGSVPCMRGLRTLFGTTPAGDRLLLKTTGATPLNPLVVELIEFQITAFDGTTPIVSIITKDLAGTVISLTEFVIADIAAGAWKNKIITSDRGYYVRYTVATGAPTVGEIYSFARIAGAASKSGT